MVLLEKIATVIKATFLEPVLEDSSLRINCNYGDNWLECIRNYIGTNVIKVKEMYSPKGAFPSPIFKDPLRGKTMDLDEAILVFEDWANEADAPLHALDIHPTTFPFGKKGYCVVGESAYPNGEIVPDVMRLYIVPAPQN